MKNGIKWLLLGSRVTSDLSLRARRVRAPGLQAECCGLVGRVPSPGASGHVPRRLTEQSTCARVNSFHKFAILAVAVLSLSHLVAQAQTTAFTYQGRLTDSDTPANGSYDMTFTIFGASSGGSAIAGPLTNAPASVSNGVFTVTLDFGAGVFPGSDRWLELGVRTYGSISAYQTLSPRRKLTSTPYSIMAANAGSLGGQSAASFAPSSGSSSYVAKAGDTMTGALNLPPNGLSVGGNQLTLSGGNVGIGTANPIRPLEAGRTNSGGIQTMAHFGSPLANANTGDGAAITIGTGNGAGKYYARIASVNEASNPNFLNPALTFSTMGGTYLAGSEVERMRISSYGLVGIGKTNPATVLDVNGTVLATNFAGNGAGLTNLSGPSAANYVFAYSTSLQAVALANTFQDLTFSHDDVLSGWSHTLGSATYTNGQSGLYLVSYNAQVTTTSTGGTNVTLRATLNGAEIGGSATAASIPTNAPSWVSVSKTFLANVNSADIFTLQMAGPSTGVRLQSFGSASTRPTISVTITRIQ
ncbi:MAG: hypothetical protein C5B50_10435 [Verrucomicrobia bacterium]|nr:MAG: hypothetical protein C5B50_10435 [Verrucomicrobiota bacterium]